MTGWRSHTEIDAWQLADQVRVEVYRICSSRIWQEHSDLRQQLTRAADSGCANMAEGFARFYPKEHARFLRIAKGSLAEVVDRLRSAVLRRLITQEEADRISRLADRAQGAATRLIRYLESSEGPSQ